MQGPLFEIIAGALYKITSWQLGYSSALTFGIDAVIAVFLERF